MYKSIWNPGDKIGRQTVGHVIFTKKQWGGNKVKQIPLHLHLPSTKEKGNINGGMLCEKCKQFTTSQRKKKRWASLPTTIATSSANFWKQPVPGVRHLIWDQLPAAFRKLSKGLAAGSLKKSGWCWYSAAQSIGVPVVGLCEVTLKFWSRNGFPICNFNGSTIKTTIQEMLCSSVYHKAYVWNLQFQWFHNEN